MSIRHVRRTARRVILEGAAGVVSRRLEERQRGLELYRQKYWDFGPTLAVEKLWELDGIKLSKETCPLSQSTVIAPNWVGQRGREA